MSDTILKIQNMTHENKISEIKLKQKHILRIQNLKHTLNINLTGGKLNGKINTR